MKETETTESWVQQLIYSNPSERIRPSERLEEVLEDANRLFYNYQVGPMPMPDFTILDYEN